MSRPSSAAGFTTRVGIGIVLGLAVTVVVGVALAPSLGRLIAPRTLEVLPTLARVGEPADIARLATAEYYGEVIATLEEVMDSVAAPANVGAYYARIRAGTESDTTALEYQLIRKLGGIDDATLLEEIRTRPWGDFAGGYTRRWRIGQALAFRAEVALLARGRVDASFDIETLQARGECVIGQRSVPLEVCPLDTDTLTIRVPEDARSVRGTVNPFFDFERRIPGFEVLEERRLDTVGDYIPMVRQLARCKLERKALDRGLLDLADLSLEQGLEGLLLALGTRVHVTVQIGRPIVEPACVRHASAAD